MAGMAATLRATRADLDVMPDDGNRYELIDGEIVVSAAPAPRHQLVVTALVVLLSGRCPDGLRVSQAPFAVELFADSVVEPDVLVFRPEDLDERGLVSPPVLVVEVLSPSTRARDLRRKKELYRRAGVASYWVVDPDDEVALTAWQLRDGHYRAVAAIAGDETWEAAEPFGVTLVPAGLRLWEPRRGESERAPGPVEQ